MQIWLLTARQFFYTSYVETKSEGKYVMNMMNIKICWFLKDSMKKKPPFGPKKYLPKNYIFKKISNFWYFLSPEALSNSPKVQISQNRRKKLTEKCKKYCSFKNFQNNSFFGKTLWNFYYFILFLD
jgi:hypothetical protein